MDKLTRYRHLIRKHLTALAELTNRSANSGVRAFCAFDEEREQYLLVSAGWAGKRRIRGTTLYLRIESDKIWVEEDWTEEGVANELLKAGVPHEDIVLGFHPPTMRRLTEFAAPS